MSPEAIGRSGARRGVDVGGNLIQEDSLGFLAAFDAFSGKLARPRASSFASGAIFD